MKSFEIKTKIHFGDNALERLAQMPYNRILVITDPFIAKGPMIKLITEPLEKAGKTYDVFSVDIHCAGRCIQHHQYPYPYSLTKYEYQQKLQ